MTLRLYLDSYVSLKTKIKIGKDVTLTALPPGPK